MKNRVNLYTQAFKPKKEYLTLMQAVVAITSALVVMLALVYMAENDKAVLEQKVKWAKNQLIEQEAEVADLSNQVSLHVQNPALIQQLARLRTRLQYRDELLVQLSDLALVQSSGFAILMSDLALQRDRDIRLNQIRLSGDRMTLTGIARTHEAIPRWIRKFSQGKSLQGREFNLLNINRNSDDVIAFTLTNQLVVEVSE
ncbi:MSHA biogenesis protein MshI [Moritella sp. JT01]|uniref:PilN domain-containing protein n=1 Tax=Moritella sp. JT01 TaxID=756698 RepID=UPI000795E98A|nr:PilN domain-containing protein [Moritella sp. JT01]KXO11277.1 MSHA biogenesis protein MshI [Moritella sp. JT01]